MKSWVTLEIEKEDLDTDSLPELQAIIDDILDVIQITIMNTMIEKEIPTTIKVTNMERDA